MIEVTTQRKCTHRHTKAECGTPVKQYDVIVNGTEFEDVGTREEAKKLEASLLRAYEAARKAAIAARKQFCKRKFPGLTGADLEGVWAEAWEDWEDN